MCLPVFVCNFNLYWRYYEIYLWMFKLHSRCWDDQWQSMMILDQQSWYFFICSFFAKYWIVQVKYYSYSLELCPQHFFLFPKLKIHLNKLCLRTLRTFKELSVTYFGSYLRVFNCTEPCTLALLLLKTSLNAISMKTFTASLFLKINHRKKYFVLLCISIWVHQSLKYEGHSVNR